MLLTSIIESLYADATFSQFSDWIEGKPFDNSHPFAKYPSFASKLISVYAAYQYCNQLFTPSQYEALVEDFPWHKLVPPSASIDTSTHIPTLWLSSLHAYTPLHYDSYGINIIVQLVGSKRWQLWKPYDPSSSPPGLLLPTRIPYEESTIFSHFDPLQHPDVKPDYEFTVEPGDVLFMPKHYWHFVTTTSPLALSMNMWLPVAEDKFDRYTESLVKFVMGSLATKLESAGLNVDHLVVGAEAENMLGEPVEERVSGMHVGYVGEALRECLGEGDVSMESLTARLSTVIDGLLSPRVINEIAKVSLQSK